MRPGREVATLTLGLSVLAAAGCSEPMGAGGPPRSVEPRLSNIADHAPCRVETLPEEPLPEVVCPQASAEEAIAALRRLRRPHAEGRGAAAPESDHAIALRLLTHGRGADAAGRAVELLERAVGARPDDPRWLSDLAAAHFVRAHAAQHPAQLVAALDAAVRALALAPDLPAARFNRALILERLGLCPQATAAWRASEGGDEGSDPGWVVEAAARRRALDCRPPDWRPLMAWATGTGREANAAPSPRERHLVATHAAEAVALALGDLLPGWAAAHLDGDQDGATRGLRRLRRLRRLGEELERSSGDRTVSLAAARIQVAPAPERRRLARAHRHYGEAAALLAASRYDEAEEGFRRVLELLPAAAAPSSATPLALWARHGILVSRVTAGDNEAARREIAALRSGEGLSELPALAARLGWQAGLVQVRTGAFAESRQSFREAARHYVAMGDSGRVAAARALEAEVLLALGLGEQAWRVRLDALRSLGRRPSVYLHNLLLDAAIAAQEEGFPHAALELGSAGLDTARALGSTSRRTEALLWRSKALAALGRQGDAFADLDAALALAAEVADPGVRRRLTADVHESRGSLLRDRDPEAAVAALSRAIPLYRRTAYAWKLPGTLLTRARAHRRLGDAARAGDDLAAALAEFERRDRALPPEVLRYSHFERAQEIFDEMIRLQVDHGQPRLALVHAERARRARWPELADPAAGEQLQPLLDSVPPNTAVVELGVSADRLFTWVVHGGEVQFLEQPLGDLDQRVEEYWQSLAAPSTPAAALETAAEELHRLLVAPWIDRLPPRTRLVFVPDRFLHRLPFGALRDGRRGRWLADDHVVSTAPSLTFATAADQRVAKKRVRSGKTPVGTVLLVGDPAFDPAEAGPLPALPGAAREVAEVRALYPNATVLTGAEATRPAVLAALERAAVVHYAGHGVTDPHRPWVSILPLAPPAAGGTGLVTARELHDRVAPRRRRAVVLSACGAASDGRQRSAGFAALVEAFLATGTDSVVASLWSVDDRAVVPLAVELHRGLAAGLSGPEALHEARRRYRQRFPEATPHRWASLQVAGVADPGFVH